MKNRATTQKLVPVVHIIALQRKVFLRLMPTNFPKRVPEEKWGNLSSAIFYP